MKKSLIAILILASLFSFALYAFDFGGSFSNFTGLTLVKPSVGLDQDNSLTLWLRTPLGKNGYFATEGGYTFSYDGSSKEITNQLDISLLKANWTFNTNAGKCPLSD